MLEVESQWRSADDVSIENKQEELDRVLASNLFARSDQLRSFLRYVCTMEMNGRAAELNEYLVGVEALGRPASYSPVDDSTVRSRAWELRQRLLKLYSEERAESSLRIDLPRGGYSPRYLVRDPQAATVAAISLASPEVIPVRMPQKRAKTPTLVVAFTSLITGMILTAAIFLLLPKRNRPRPLDPMLRKTWGPLLSTNAEDLLVLSNGYYLLIRPERPPSKSGSLTFPVPEDLYAPYREKRPLEQGRKLTMYPSTNAIQMGYVNGLVATTNVLQNANATFSILPERIVSLPSLRNRNVVLFGAPQDSEIIKEMMAGTAFQFGYSPTFDLVINKDGKEQYHLITHEKAKEAYTTYGLITVMPSMGSESGQKQTVILSGITSVGAQGAAEFFSSPNHMRQALDHLGNQKKLGFPPSYQILVRCEGSNTLLMSFEYADSAINSSGKY